MAKTTKGKQQMKQQTISSSSPKPNHTKSV